MLLGIGEQIREINTNFKYYMLIIKPNKEDFFKTSTKEMFEKFDNTNDINQIYNSKEVEQALVEENLYKLCENLYNVFEETIKTSEIIKMIKGNLTKEGAKVTLMTGSRLLYIRNFCR